MVEEVKVPASSHKMAGVKSGLMRSRSKTHLLYATLFPGGFRWLGRKRMEEGTPIQNCSSYCLFFGF